MRDQDQQGGIRGSGGKLRVRRVLPHPDGERIDTRWTQQQRRRQFNGRSTKDTHYDKVYFLLIKIYSTN